MRYIKTYENFNVQVTNEEFLGIGKKLKELIAKAKEISTSVVSSMSDEEKQEALNFMDEKGLTPEVAQQISSKMKLETPEAAAEVIQDVVPEVAEVANEGLKEVIIDRIIRFVGNPAISGFLLWLSSVVLRATAIGWAEQPDWILKIHDALTAYNLQGPVSLFVYLTAFLFTILTIAKMFHGRKLEN
jgi:hypothetical protein